MRVVLLAAAGLIAAAAVTAPAAAQSGASAGFSGVSGVTVHHNRGFTSLQSRHGDRNRRDRRRHDDGFADGGFYYDREYEGDTLWRAESYNDWWHERPWRAYPAWMTRNKNCERQYWSGGGWTC